MEIIVAISGDRPAEGSLSEYEVVCKALQQYVKERIEVRARDRERAAIDPEFATEIYGDKNMNSYATEIETYNALHEKLVEGLKVNKSGLSVNANGIIESDS